MSHGLPSTMIGRMRLVTQALALIAPRWLDTSTQSPFLMPLALASRSPISTNSSGCSDGVVVHVLGPVVEVLGQPIAGRHDRELVGRAERLGIGREHPHHRVGADLGVQRVGDVGVHRLVVLGERPVGHGRAGEQPGGAFLVHDERADRLVGRDGRRVVGHVAAGPAAAVPPARTSCARSTACRRDRPRRGCRARAGWPATRSPSWDRCRARSGRCASRRIDMLPASV